MLIIIALFLEKIIAPFVYLFLSQLWNFVDRKEEWNFKEKIRLKITERGQTRVLWQGSFGLEIA
jgi:hypothetical protein